jgi:7,8-dihydro-6-hydroxymethylpterin-pyrophosphokinase
MSHAIIGIETEGVESWEVMGELARLINLKYQIETCSTVWQTHGMERLVCAVKIGTTEKPRTIQETLEEMEKALGPGRHGGLTLLIYGDVFSMTPDLTLPHPALRTDIRWIVSASELAPDWIHPVSRKSLIELSRATAGQTGLEFNAQGYSLLDFCRSN